ncbi:hypothetical protein [Salirhabdus salicampi]|uniref:hypothetical protein n=1 Tax=Salirhabdus salicampi TaxID=476102 RepID=UPI0020C2CD09|nr:hypothetical protein [Salirhabdus salicampi]MCP8616161.1 hypothetical protein [Salirhabdus salicampi]
MMAIKDPENHLKKIRDVTLFQMNKEQYLMIACHSNAGMGNKAADFVNVPEESIAQFAVRDPLFEIIALRGKPFYINESLTVEFDPTGKKISEAIKDYVCESGITDDIQFSCSTEDYIPTIQTGIGITVLGLVNIKDFQTARTEHGDVLAVVGKPKCNLHDKVNIDDQDIISLSEINLIHKLPYVHDIFPVGAKGIQHELDRFTVETNLEILLEGQGEIDFQASAGFSTCVIISLPRSQVTNLRNYIQSPVNIIGSIK